MLAVNKYRLRCTTEAAYKYVWASAEDPVPTLCPTNSAHSVDQAATAIVETVSEAKQRADGVLYSVPKPSSFGFEMCNRDFRLKTCLLDGSVEDLKVNTQTNKEESWGELNLVGVYKLSAGNMVACATQEEADLSGILSVWDYAARSGGSQIRYEVRDGFLVVDPTLPAAQRWDHRAYAVVAPQIPAAYGGSIAVFDGYLGAAPNGLVASLSPQCAVLDPAGAAGPAGAVMRIYIFHPAGNKLIHLLQLVTYRAPGTF